MRKAGQGFPARLLVVCVPRRAYSGGSAGAMLTAQFELLRARAERAEQHAELAVIAERIARRELDQLRAELDIRQWSLWRRLRWALRGR